MGRKTVFGKYWARSKSSPPACRDFSWLLQPHTLKYKQCIGGGLFCVLFLTSILGGLQSWLWESLKNAEHFQCGVLGHGHQRFPQQQCEYRGVKLSPDSLLPLIIAFIIHMSQAWGSRMTTVYEPQTELSRKPFYTRTLWNPWPLAQLGWGWGVCGSGGMVMVNSMQHAFRMFP